MITMMINTNPDPFSVCTKLNFPAPSIHPDPQHHTALATDCIPTHGASLSPTFLSLPPFYISLPSGFALPFLPPPPMPGIPPMPMLPIIFCSSSPMPICLSCCMRTWGSICESCFSISGSIIDESCSRSAGEICSITFWAVWARACMLTICCMEVTKSVSNSFRVTMPSLLPSMASKISSAMSSERRSSSTITADIVFETWGMYSFMPSSIWRIIAPPSPPAIDAANFTPVSMLCRARSGMCR
mmetsp:Transcript_1925/g.4350  ORF Transcript_1925/g.4350 Transcript_1925/m.4350 type:complete len:243 (+) Transcript_1925:100-828(+)